MSFVKISQLPAASQANTTDELEANQAGTSRKVTAAQLRDGLLPTSGGTLTGSLAVTSGNVGIGTTSPAVRLAVVSTDAMLVPVGTTAQRPTGATGYFRYNSTTNSFEGHNGTEWGAVGGGGGGQSPLPLISMGIY